MRALLTLLIVLVLLAVGADRIALVVAEHRVASAVQSKEHLDSRPKVSISGFPFLTQVVSGSYHGGSITMKNVTAAGSAGEVKISDVTVKATGLHVSRGFSTGTADALTGTALLSYPDLSSALGTSTSYGGASTDGMGKIKVSGSVTILGQSLTGFVTAEVVVAGVNQLGFGSVGLEGVTVPQSAVSALSAAFGRQLSLKNLPAGLTIRSVTAQPDGVIAVVSGSNVSLTG